MAGVLEQREQSGLRRKQCSRCGTEFGCARGEPGCWCESIVLRRETLAELQTLADDCLCPTCLAGFAERDARLAGEASASGARGGRTWAKTVPDAAVRARGVPLVWGLCILLLLVGSLLVALAIGPISIGPVAIVESALGQLERSSNVIDWSFEDSSNTASRTGSTFRGFRLRRSQRASAADLVVGPKQVGSADRGLVAEG